MLDTSDAYGPLTNEILVGKAVKGMKEKVQICTKFGIDWDGVSATYDVRGDPEFVRAASDASLKRLDTEYIDLYYQHRIDEKNTIEITMGELKKLVQEGKIRYIGLSEASALDIRRAHAVHPVTAVQVEYSLWARDVEEDIIPTCRELGIGIVTYSPLGRGFFSGKNLEDFSDNDYRKAFPTLRASNCKPGEGGLFTMAIKGIRDKVQLATKFGVSDPVTGARGVRNDPEYIRECFEGSLKRLDVDYIDLYYVHRVDKDVPIEITIGEMKKFIDEGKLKYLGMSEASASDIRRAHAVHPITAIQLEYSLWSRDVEEDIIPTCRELGIGLVSYSPLGRGFFSGVQVQNLTDGDGRKSMVPRFQPGNLEKNQIFFQRLVEIGAKHGRTPGQVALAWVQHQGADVVPIPGTTKVKNLEENVGALAIKFSKEELSEIEAAVPVEEVAGDRYTESGMQITWQHTFTIPLSQWKA